MLTRDDVVGAYSYFLGREPESEAVIRSWQKVENGGSTGPVAFLAGLAALGSAHPPPYADLAGARVPDRRQAAP